ncbi:OX-2 membrane glycoprotein-like [Xenentodon cancila]
MLLFLFVVSWLVKDVVPEIEIYGNDTAEYGGEAHCRCTASSSKGVRQVTWQRLFKEDSIENLATYSKLFGQQVNEPHRGKVVFTEATLNSSSISLRNVTWGDEGCYICSFNAYPDGSKRKEFCLTVKGISDVSTSHIPSRSQEGEEPTYDAFTCSATGKPAPTIDWVFPPGAIIVNQTETTVVKNSDKTFTSSQTITLKIPADSCVPVDCVLNSGSMGHRRIPFDCAPGENKGKDPSLSYMAVAITLVVVIAVCVVAAFLFKRKRSPIMSRNETGMMEMTSTNNHERILSCVKEQMKKEEKKK